MTDRRTPSRHGRPYAFFIGCAAFFLMLTVAAVAVVAFWFIPNAQVSTMPAPPEPPATPETPLPRPPAFLLHVKPSVPEVATLLGDALGAQAMMITTLLPYEGTFTVEPSAEGTAAIAELRLSVPRSAAALHVLARAQIDQPTPSGYVVRSVERPETGVLQLLLDGPLGPEADPPHTDTPVIPTRPLSPESVALITIHNEDGAWTRIVTGYIQNFSALETPPELSVAQLVSANLQATFAGVDVLLWDVMFTCASPLAAATLKSDLETALADVQAQDNLGLVYAHELTVAEETITGNVRITGIQNAAKLIAQAYQAAEAEPKQPE
jgi:hypothetical protein